MTPSHFYYAGMALGVIGLVLLFMSIIPAWRRRAPVWTTLWAPREMFQGRELLLNRIGFGLAIVGILLLMAALFQLGR